VKKGARFCVAARVFVGSFAVLSRCVTFVRVRSILAFARAGPQRYEASTGSACGLAPAQQFLHQQRRH
jgi:hypothetical protein